MDHCKNCKYKGQTSMCKIGYEDYLEGGASIQVPMRRAREVESYCGAGARYFVDKDDPGVPGENELYIDIGKDNKGKEYVRVLVEQDGIDHLMAGVNAKGRLAALTNNSERAAHSKWSLEHKVCEGEIEFRGVVYGINKYMDFYYKNPDSGIRFYIFNFAHCRVGEVEPAIIDCYPGTPTPILHTRI